MGVQLSTEELDIAKEIINIGLSKAADSMAFFTKGKVLARSIDLQLKDIESIENITQKNDDELLYILTTELKGELEGICYLVFSQKEVEQITKISFPSSIIEDKEKLEVMTEAILLEMDNIIVASVVTLFSNLFKYKMYGDVPRLFRELPGGLAKEMQSFSKSFKYVLYFKSELSTNELDLNPEFIWLLDDKYINGVKSIAGDEVLLGNMRGDK